MNNEVVKFITEKEFKDICNQRQGLFGCDKKIATQYSWPNYSYMGTHEAIHYVIKKDIASADE